MLTLEGFREQYYDAAAGCYTYWPIAADLLVPDAADILWKIPAAAAHRPDRIAVLHYGDPTWEWVIPLVNGCEDPIVDLAADRVVLVPARNRVLNALAAHGF